MESDPSFAHKESGKNLIGSQGDFGFWIARLDCIQACDSRYSSMEYPCWCAANTCMITSIVIQNSKWQLFMPLWAIFPTRQVLFPLRASVTGPNVPQAQVKWLWED